MSMNMMLHTLNTTLHLLMLCWKYDMTKGSIFIDYLLHYMTWWHLNCHRNWRWSTLRYHWHSYRSCKRRIKKWFIEFILAWPQKNMCIIIFFRLLLRALVRAIFMCIQLRVLFRLSGLNTFFFSPSIHPSNKNVVAIVWHSNLLHTFESFTQLKDLFGIDICNNFQVKNSFLDVLFILIWNWREK